jgi:hypothetical protein
MIHQISSITKKGREEVKLDATKGQGGLANEQKEKERDQTVRFREGERKLLLMFRCHVLFGSSTY